MRKEMERMQKEKETEGMWKEMEEKKEMERDREGEHDDLLSAVTK
jgi:hypothetical protein